MPYKHNPNTVGLVVFLFFLISSGLKFGIEQVVERAHSEHEPALVAEVQADPAAPQSPEQTVFLSSAD
ncbi:MAG: hypothetical protein ABJ308_03830 [Halieaceae bacterium]